MSKTRTIFAAFGILVTTGLQSPAAATGGAELVLVEDSFDRTCIDANQDQVSIALARIVTTKIAGFLNLTEETAVDLLLNATVESRHGQTTERTTIPLARKIDLQPFSEGLVVLPARFRLISQMPLVGTDYRVIAIDLEFSLFKTSEPSLATRILKEIADKTAGAPLPPTVYGEGAKFFAGLVDGMLDQVLAAAEADGNGARHGSLPFEFSADGRCERIGATTGTYAFIQEAPNPDSAGAIRLEDINRYCFDIFAPGGPLSFDRLRPDGTCPRNPVTARPVANPHTVFALDGRPKPGATTARTVLPSERKISPDLKGLLEEDATVRHLVARSAPFSANAESLDFDVVNIAPAATDDGKASSFTVKWAAERPASSNGGIISGPTDGPSSNETLRPAIGFVEVPTTVISEAVTMSRCRLLEIPPDQCF